MLPHTYACIHIFLYYIVERKCLRLRAPPPATPTYLLDLPSRPLTTSTRTLAPSK